MDKKIIFGIIVGILLISFIFALGNRNVNVVGSTINENIGNLHEVDLEIKDMYCVACAYGVKAQFEELDGVVRANVSYKEGKGTILYDADKVNVETIAAASTVYPAKVINDKLVN